MKPPGPGSFGVIKKNSKETDTIPLEHTGIKTIFHLKFWLIGMNISEKW